MLAKFSVKKPYTVIVGIVLILVLGVVAATRMTTDLLPSMELPYAIIVTTYAGASPETVEEAVSKPLESSMATLNNIKTVSSQSSENYSVVILEFNNDTNMDSASIDIREKIDQLKTYWPDEVSNPIMIKMNPDMMPVMVASVDIDGMDSIALTDYINDTLSDTLEGVDGVASVTPMGTVTQTVDVTISEKKLEALNKKIISALDKKFADAEEEISSNQDKLSSGKKQLDQAKDAAREKINQGSTTLQDMKLDLLKNEMQINDALTQLLSAEKEIASGKKELETQKTTVEDAITKLETVYGQYQALAAQKATLEQALTVSPDDAGLNAQYQGVVSAMQTIEQAVATQKDQNGNALSVETLPATITALKTGLKQINDGLSEVKKNEKTITAKKKQLSAALTKITDGKATLNDQIQKLEKSQAEAEEQFIEHSVEIADGQKALDDAKKQFDDQKESSYDNLDMTTIITEDMVKGILSAQNFSMPAGYVTEEHQDYLIRVGDKFDSIDAMKDFVLMDLNMDDVDPIRLSDVADVELTDNSADSYVKINDNEGMIISIAKQTGYSTSDVADRLKAKFDEITQEDEKIHFVQLMDQGIYIDMIVKSVLQNLASGALLAILILFIFLRDIRPTGIIAVSIPVSVVFAVVMMYFSGVTLNVISLSGLALGVGMLVDNSIVVIENIYRLRSLGYSKKEAAIEGAKSVTGAITASTATTVSVFAPIIFTSGITRMLFVDMALTILYSLLASLIIAVTFVPMVAAGVLKSEKEKKTGWFEKLTGAYQKGLRWALRHKAVVFIVVIVAFVGSTVLAVSNGASMMPSMDSTQMSMTMTMPEGTVDLKETAKMSDQIIDKVLEIDDIETVGAMVGGDSMSMLGLGGSGGSVDTVSYYILCKEDKKHSNEEISRMITEKTKDFDCEVSVTASTMDMSALGASGVVLRVTGKDLDTLADIANQVADKLKTVNGLTDISNGQEDVTPEIRFTVDKDKAAEYGLTVAQVYQAIYAKIADPKAATKLETTVKDYDVMVKSDSLTDVTIEDLKDLKVEGTVNNEKKQVKVSKIADFEEKEGLSTINRSKQKRYISVTASVEDGYNASLLSPKVKQIVDDMELPQGYQIEYDGENETTMEAMKQVGLMMLLAVIFMYMIMVIQFQSFLSPFIIMFTIPLAFTGGFLGLIIGRMDVSVIAMIGMVMLAGIIVNNGIVLVDAINQMREQGIPKRDAIMESAGNRLRPVIMTALTTIFGMSTMAFGSGMGSDMAQPMAVVVIGGLIYGTLLTLFLVPCVYDVFNRKELKKESE